MMMRLFLLISVAIAASAASNTFLGKTLGSNMVLQRDSSSRLYGYSSAAGATISVSFVIYSEAFSVSTTSSQDQAADGGFRWVAELPPMAGSFTEYTVNITSSAGENAILDNVVFGDVYLCSGQSNMQFSVPGDFDAAAEIAAADDYPFIRIMSVGQGYNLPQTTTPLEDLYFLDMLWAVGSSASVNGGEWGHMSATCWFFGKDLFDSSLQRAVPLGLVSDNWGGTPVEAWSPPSVMQQCGEAARETDHPNPDNKVPNIHIESDFNPNAYSVLYNTMIYPFRDMNIKGALWYQGETNVYSSDVYPCLQDGMVRAWRELLGVDFPFLYVQLSTWDNGGNGVIANFRFAQTSIMAITDKSAMITAADLGDPDSPYDPIHPRNKTEIGRRLALAASSLIYGAADVPYLGPLVESVTAFQDPTYGWSVRVTFSTSSCGEGVHLQAPQQCPACSAEDNGGCGDILLEYPSVGQVKVITTVSSAYSVDFVPSRKMLQKPLNLYYCLGDYPLMTIYNSIGAPLIPFAVPVP